MPSLRPTKKRPLRFVCVPCGFTVNCSPGVTYAGANRALGLNGWRIEQRMRKGGAMWVPVCNACARPDPPKTL